MHAILANVVRKLAAPASVAALALTPALDARAIDDLFDKSSGEGMHGFLEVKDAAYAKECGSCHFAYSPGMLPARSWERMMSRLDRHFGESLGLDGPVAAAIGRYLAQNAADRSPYAGSKVLMESIPEELTPARIQAVPRLRTAHRVMREVIARNFRVKVRTLVNCDGCHQRAAAGDFSLAELRVDGLHGLRLIRPNRTAFR